MIDLRGLFDKDLFNFCANALKNQTIVVTLPKIMATDYLPGNRYITNNELSFFKSLPASEKMFYYKKLKEIHPEILSNRQEDVLAEL